MQTCVHELGTLLPRRGTENCRKPLIFSGFRGIRQAAGLGLASAPRTSESLSHDQQSSQKESNKMRNKQKGFSLIELLIVVAIILIIAAIAIPNLLRAKIAANQASAVGSLRTLNTSCIAYSTSYDQFPSALTNLGPIASGGTATSTSADLIDSMLSAGTKSGYTFVYTAGALNQSYSITATPITVGTTGQSMYYTDQSGVIRVNHSGSGANSASPPIG